MKKVIAILMLFLITATTFSQTRFGRGIKLYNASEITDFRYNYNLIPVMRTDGFLNRYIHSDSLALKSDLLNLGKTYEAGDGITIINDTINNNNYFQFFQKNYPSPAFGSVEFGIGTTGNESTIGISRTIGGLPRFNLKNITVINGVNTENLILKNLNISSANVTSSKTVTFQDKSGEIALISDIKDYQAGSNITIDNTNPQQPIINAVSNGYVPYTGATQNIDINTKNILLNNGDGGTMRIVGDNIRQIYQNKRSTLSPEHLNFEYTNNGFSSSIYSAQGSVVKGGALNSYLKYNRLGFEKEVNGYFQTIAVSSNLPTNATQDNLKTLNLPFKDGILATVDDIPLYQAGTNITIDNTNPQQPIINATGGTVGATDLGVTTNSDTITVTSSSGNDVVLPLATTTTAGLQKSNFYEEGTFTPNLNHVYAGSSFTYTVSVAKYYRVGNIVSFELVLTGINTTGTPNSNSQIRLNGLPFVSKNIRGFPLFVMKGISTTQKDYSFFTQYNTNYALLYFGGTRPDSSYDNVSEVRGASITNGKIYVSGSYITNVYTP